MGRRHFSSFFLTKRNALRGKVQTYVTTKTNERNTAISSTLSRKDEADSAATVVMNQKATIRSFKDSADNLFTALQSLTTGSAAEAQRGLIESLAEQAANALKEAEEARLVAESKALDAAKFYEGTRESTTALSYKNDADSARDAAIEAVKEAKELKAEIDRKLTLAVEETSDIKLAEFKSDAGVSIPHRSADPHSAAEGTLYYHTGDDKLYLKTGDGFGSVGGGPSLGSNSIIRTNSKNIQSNITVDSNTNAMSVGPITVDSGYTVTVNGRWNVV